MATQTKFENYVEGLGKGLINHDSAGAEMVALSNTAPSAANDVDLSDITEIAAGNGYAAGGNAIGANDYEQVGGVAELTGGNVTFTASGGSIGPFRYLVRYNTFGGNNRLISYIDVGAGGITIPDGVNCIIRWDDGVSGLIQSVQ